MLKWSILIIAILLFNTVAIFMKKRLKISEIYTTVIFGLLASTIADLYASYRFKAWGFFEVEKLEFSVVLILLGIYPAVTVMIINWYPYKSNWTLKLCYLMGWTVFSTAYEWLTVKTGILWHINWNFILFLYNVSIYLLYVNSSCEDISMDQTKGRIIFKDFIFNLSVYGRQFLGRKSITNEF
ncbi:hypothetical protein ABE288_20840 [Bacillus salipaludis]|uniref:CBO0543 family protein n=1 Tax=Bacillus salipaludis TaxID=2547811 RepID=UPI003D1E99D5